MQKWHKLVNLLHSPAATVTLIVLQEGLGRLEVQSLLNTGAHTPIFRVLGHDKHGVLCEAPAGAAAGAAALIQHAGTKEVTQQVPVSL